MNELNNFFLGVQQVAQDAVDKAPYDRTFRGVIEEINGDGTYDVRINGRTYENIPCKSTVQVDEIVDVLFPQNNPSLMKIVNVPFDYSQPWAGDLNVNGNVYIQGSQMVDYIVEQGESGIWTYRKWNSGIAECWGRYSFDSKIDNPWGALYESTPQTVNYPNGLFKSGSTPVVTAFAAGTTWSCMLESSGRGYDTTTPTFYAVRADAISSAAVEFNINIKAVGLWK